MTCFGDKVCVNLRRNITNNIHRAQSKKRGYTESQLIGTQRLHVQDQGKPPRWRTSAVVWHGEGSAMPCDITQNTPHEDDNYNSVHTGSVVARNENRTFRCWPSGRRWKACDWRTKIVTCQKQHHYRHLECEITDSSRKGWRTNSWNEEIPMEHPWTLWSTVRKKIGEMSTPEDHKLFSSGSEGRHEHGVGFLIHKDIVNAIMGCRPVSSQLIAIRLQASPLNITII